jgi:hypothetical protein
MREYTIRIPENDRTIRPGSLKLGGSNPEGECISFMDYYMQLNGAPFFGICGEFHYSRYPHRCWEEELIKIKGLGVNIVSSYIFWNHHEEEEGVYNWEGDKNLRAFTELCAKHSLYVILRIGPFVHGEVRNGGFPDWLYGRPFTVRTNDEGYLFYAQRLYNEIGQQVCGLMYGEGGPVIGIQLENEHMHASPPWECTHPKLMEWVGNGSGGAGHIRKLMGLAKQAGMDVPVYTCTGWGGASFLEDETLPLFGGYSFEPWRKAYMGEQKHRRTEEYLMRSFHDGKQPYACCELGGGMACWYEYRFQVPPESVEASTLVRVAGGCNFIGYYMIHDGTNPTGAHCFLNERNVPQISYNFQSPVGEFGQLRESYRLLKPILYFLKDFEGILCPMGTVLPEEAALITPGDSRTLRYAVRQKDGSGFIFLINYQDHSALRDQRGLSLRLELKEETIPVFEGLTLKKGVCAILPFNLELDGIKLKYATAQPITFLEEDGGKTFFFFVPDGMKGSYCFDASGIESLCCSDATCNMEEGRLHIDVEPGSNCRIELKKKNGGMVRICTLTREQSLNLWKCRLWGRDRIVLTDSELLLREGMLELRNTGNPCFQFGVYPAIDGIDVASGQSEGSAGDKQEKHAGNKPLHSAGAVIGGRLTAGRDGIFSVFAAEQPERSITMEVLLHGEADAEVKFPGSRADGGKDGGEAIDFENEVFLRVDYAGDVGYALIDGKLAEDDFFNGRIWEIGLARFMPRVAEKGMNIHIVPLPKGSGVVFEKEISFRHAADGNPRRAGRDAVGRIYSIEAVPRYTLRLKCEEKSEETKNV